jgi:hypothetical protein
MSQSERFVCKKSLDGPSDENEGYLPGITPAGAIETDRRRIGGTGFESFAAEVSNASA